MLSARERCGRRATPDRVPDPPARQDCVESRGRIAALAGCGWDRCMRRCMLSLGFVLCLVAVGQGVSAEAPPGGQHEPVGDTDRGEQQQVRLPHPTPAGVAPSSRASLRSLIDRAAARYGLEPALVHAVVFAESAYNPEALSPKGAIGLMQIMPATGADYGVPNPADLYDPAVNVRVGVRHLRRLLRKYNNDYRSVILAYNAGEAVVDRTGGKVPYRETLDYAARVIRSYRRFGGTRSVVDTSTPAAMMGRSAGHGRTNRTSPAPDRGRILPKSSPRLNRDLAGTVSLEGTPSADRGPKRNDPLLQQSGTGRAVDPACDNLQGGAGLGRSAVVRRCSRGPARVGSSQRD